MIDELKEEYEQLIDQLIEIVDEEIQDGYFVRLAEKVLRERFGKWIENDDVGKFFYRLSYLASGT